MVTSLKLLLLLTICFVALTSLTSCSLKEEIREEALRELIWPPPPAKPKIKLKSVISSPQDLGITKNIFEKFWDSITGKGQERLVSPYCIETDSGGRIYVIDTALKNIHVFDQQAEEYYLFDTKASPLEFPIDLAIDDTTGYIYVTDSIKATIYIYADKGKTYVGEFGGEQLKRPTGIAINVETSELYVVDTLKSEIFRYDLQNYAFLGAISSRGDKKEELNFPTHIFINEEGNILVTDTMNFRISTFSKDGIFLYSVGEMGDTEGFLSRPKGVAQDKDGNIYIVDALQDNVQVFNKTGELLVAFGNKGMDPGQFWLPAGIAIDNKNDIYVADSYNHRIQIFQYLSSN